MAERARVVAPAEVDHQSVDGFSADLAGCPNGAVVEVDCGAVEFMDSAGVRALSIAAQRQRDDGGDLVIVAATPVVRRLLRITALESLLADGAEAGADTPA